MSACSVRRINPLDDEELEQRSPLGLTRSGRPVWPVFGAEGDDDDSDDDDVDDDADDDDDAKAQKGKGDTKTGDDDEDDPVAAAEARAEKYRARMRAADRARAAAERERDALKAGKGKEGDEDTSAVVAEKDQQIETLSEANRRLTLQNAFLLNNTHTWHDPEDVMALALQDEDLEVDDDGVHGMADVLKKIARKKPWLVKKDEPAGKGGDDGDDDDDDDTEDEPPARRTGSNNSGRRKPKQVDRQKLLSTYPALRRR
jgi:hypothetical protein